jgi:hypothetical protein
MIAHRQAFPGQCQLPLIASTDPVALVEKAFCFLSGGQPGELGVQGMLRG